MNYLRCLFFIYLLSSSVAAQDKSEYSYQPFIMDGTCEWHSREYLMAPGNLTIDNRRVISNDDSLFQGRTYKIIYDYPSCSVKEGDKVYGGLIREENKRVYYVGSTFSYSIYDTEVLLYDFNLGVGDEITYPYLSESLKISRIDTILVEGVWRRNYYFGSLDSYSGPTIGYGWLEGLGDLKFYGITDPFAPIPTTTIPSVECVVHGDNNLYKQYPEEDCPCANLNDLSSIKEESRIHFYVKDQMLCIHAPDQVYTTLRIYTSDGKLVKSMSLREQTDEITSSLEGLVPGSYLFIVGSSDSQQSGAFIVQ
jgi:hypothetical protein